MLERNLLLGKGVRVRVEGKARYSHRVRAKLSLTAIGSRTLSAVRESLRVR